MRVYLIFSVFSAVSLSLWCSCQSTDCRSVSASAALHTLSLRPECSNADTELLTIAWTNTYTAAGNTAEKVVGWGG